MTIQRIVSLTAALVVGLLAGLQQPARAADAKPFDYEDYAAVLEKYVDAQGMVDYKALKRDRKRIDQFAADLAELDSDRYDEWADDQKLALWINAYNGLTLVVIINNYPLERSLGFKYLAYPSNSIRQIPGVWKKIHWTVMGKRVTLHQMEHEIMRKDFDEPRIHLALVCAAMGCPQLRREPYIGEKLDKQLDDQMEGFVKHPRKFRIDRGDDEVYVSSIFKWFGEDFVPAYVPERGFSDLDRKERAVLNFHCKYLSKRDCRYLRYGDYDIDYLDYDWSLNEQK